MRSPPPRRAQLTAAVDGVAGGDPPRGIAALRRADWRLGTLAEKLPLDEEALAEVAARYRLRIPHYYRELIREPGDPIWRQCIPSPEELAESELPADPLAEDDPRHAPVPHL
ncbi:MAG: hypothetical protein IIA14_03295, partial [SAR324 cluster bacterium]|nr:hypothetical protein [SAR324 cluster bacterium]